MSQENVEIIGRMYDAWLAGDFETVYATFDEDIEVHPDPEATWVGLSDVYRGHDGIRNYMKAVYEAFEDYRPDIERLIDAGEQVLTLAVERGRGRGSGADVQSNKTAHVWTVQGGRATRLDLYLDRDKAIRAVGLEE
jgi:uncharacterized protein